jgi:hypothetical protein
MRIKFFVASLFLISTVAVVYAQQQSLRANIPFAFTVGSKQLPAGDYQFTTNTNDRNVRVSSNKDSALAVILTRMAAGIHTTTEDAHVVFDKLGDQYFLAEIWIPGVDGFDLHNTTQKHEHRIINVPVK